MAPDVLGRAISGQEPKAYSRHSKQIGLALEACITSSVYTAGLAGREREPEDYAALKYLLPRRVRFDRRR